MSRNDIILVVVYRGTYRVVHVDADVAGEDGFALSHVRSCDWFTRSRARALIRAHDVQKRVNSEYGVREVHVPSE